MVGVVPREGAVHGCRAAEVPLDPLVNESHLASLQVKGQATAAARAAGLYYSTVVPLTRSCCTSKYKLLMFGGDCQKESEFNSSKLVPGVNAFLKKR